MSGEDSGGGLSRRRVLGGGLAVAGLGLLGRARVEAKDEDQLFCAPLVPFRVSLSVSPFSEAVLQATALGDGTYVARSVPDLQSLYLRHGATEVFARIATRKVAPQGPIADHGWARGLERARLARDMQLPFNPELGLWAEYGDAGNYQQPPDFRDYPHMQLPKPWTDLTLEEMLRPLRQYGALVARQILDTGARVNLWDIGNEIEYGIAGVTVRPLTAAHDYKAPDGVDPAIGQMSAAQLIAMSEQDRIGWSRAHLWPHVGRLLAAVADGVRSVYPKARFSTHISPLAQKTSAVHLAFWETLKDAGFFPDEFGLSYYPGLGRSMRGPEDSLQWFKDLTTALKARHGRPSFIAEGGYASGVMPPPFLFNDVVEGYALDEAGQHRFNRDLIDWGAESGALAGYRPWAPDLCTVPGWEPMSWFKPEGNIARPKPVLRSFEEALPGLYVSVASRPTAKSLRISMRTSGAALPKITVELHDEERLLASGAIDVDSRWKPAALHSRRGRIPGGRHRLTIRSGERVLMRRRVTVA